MLSVVGGRRCTKALGTIAGERPDRSPVGTVYNVTSMHGVLGQQC